MGSKDDHLFPILPIQGERREKKKKNSHRGMEGGGVEGGVAHPHLQNTRL